MYENQGNFNGLDSWHVQASQVIKMERHLFMILYFSIQAPIDWKVYIFRQDRQPVGWNQQDFGVFEPMNILLCKKIPSRNQSESRCNYNVVIAFKP